MPILLTTLNARYAHASLGLRYLYANMGALTAHTRLQEFVIGARSTDLAEKILQHRCPGEPLIVAFGVYIWNTREITQLIQVLKRIAPDVLIVLGGPEVSQETETQTPVALADYVVTGWGDISFPALCAQLWQGLRPAQKIHPGIQPPLTDIALPYDAYTDHDLRYRTVYVEASRGCPFKCEFCLSSLDKTAWPFPLEPFLAALERLYQRGARTFKFLDRTFNLNIKVSLRILDFFLDKLAAQPDERLHVHFELIPDHLTEPLKAAIARFPPGSLQFEIGIQSFNPEVQARINRRQDNALAETNLRWLTESSHAHIHVDLIAGLPGETLESFATGFDRLVRIGPHEIQFGILKRLRGTPIIRHTEAFAMVFDPEPPYSILANRDLPFADMQRLVRFSRYWDMVANSARFMHTLPLLLGETPFSHFLAFSDWLYARTEATHQIALDRLADLVRQWLSSVRGLDQAQIDAALAHDYAGQPQHRQAPRKSTTIDPLPRQSRRLRA